ncbi:uncharacterized protein N7515_001710 [Penicillium bovifimosum]|uniref:Carboxylic ester hydrolase n=1 Tax=Penicillium bovifimosum TaxID=126998 RepID=A0A9W9L8J9_9EURO|nr:uncharacterized protein N7515_001710 [Penicillium bovifimosum]KAJ5142923.1 hypothetical protein N7515_001710 [Penicillium bovifimosum]
MNQTRRTHLKSLAHRGTIQGVTISTETSTPKDLCHYYGGVRYGLAPSQRWRRAKPLPASFTYGSAEAPGLCDSGAGLCPQPGFLHLSPENPDAWNEDCFQCNIWTPIGDEPEGGWPVFVFIHGGWLQFGTPNSFNAASLIGSAGFKSVIVMPAYRVNLFGFLYSSELAADSATANETTGNHGFWDQRLALEWTKENIRLFGGDPSRITISGYSAGANSVFHQLAHDLRQPAENAIINQAVIWSNSPTVPPKKPAETQTQFDELLTALDIPLTLPAAEKVSHLRSKPAKQLLDTVSKMQLHQFRPTTDGDFISEALFESLDSGAFAQALLDRNIRVIIGECADERFLYSTWYPPKADTLSALRDRLVADYPAHIVDAVVDMYYPGGELPGHCRDWGVDAWGRVYADLQVHCMQRGFVDALTGGNSGGVDAKGNLFRYRIEWRAKCVDAALPVEWGVTHSSDYPVWFYGNGAVLGEREGEVVKGAFLGPLGRFVNREREFGWGVDGRGVRVLRKDGGVEVGEDEGWDEGVRVWKRLREVDLEFCS